VRRARNANGGSGSGPISGSGVSQELTKLTEGNCYHFLRFSPGAQAKGRGESKPRTPFRCQNTVNTTQPAPAWTPRGLVPLR